MNMDKSNSCRSLHRVCPAVRALTTALLVSTGVATLPSHAAEHTLMPTPQTVHIGHFLAALKPVLSIESGDIVTLESTASIVPAIVDQSGVVPTSAVPQYQRDIYGSVPDRGPGPHVLTGPIEIKGAMPGDVLEIRILDVQLALDWGYNRQRPYTGTLPDEFPALWNRIIPINRSTKTAEVARGVIVPVDKPFFGIMGLAPDSGRISSGPPGVHTGNVDNKDLIAGTTLYMPVHAPGALFSAGDAHAAQGHGEVRGRSDRDRNRNARQVPVHCPQGHEATLAARRDADALDGDGPQSRSGRGDEDRR